MRLAITVLMLIAFSLASAAEVDFLIPGGKGGGWDTTARETGKALIKTGGISNVRYMNVSGGGGGRALHGLVQGNYDIGRTLMVHSTPLLIRNLSGVFDKSYRDIQPVALMIAEYQVVAVTADSPYRSIRQLLDKVKEDFAKYPILGGSSRGSLDHITASLLFSKAGLSPHELRYAISNGGGDALKRLYSGVGIALITGYGEVAKDHEEGRIRILGVASEQPLPGLSIPTLRQQGYDVVLMNWRGFFANKKISSAQLMQTIEVLKQLNQSEQWLQSRSKFGWIEFFKHGDNLQKFLDTQNDLFRSILLEVDSSITKKEL